MESKKINQLATELTPALSDLTIIGDPTTGISKKITLSQMASLFTGTVEEYANLAAFPLVGVADTIYIALDTNVLYRWNTGTNAYVELSPNIINSLVFSDANGFDGNISLVGSVATLTITTALTQGSVAFIGASGALSQDNANYFWDNTNKRLGINTNTPTTAIDVFGSGIIGRLNGTSTNNAFLGFASAGTNKWSIGNVQSDHRFRIYSEANTSELVSVLQTGEFGIGIANPTTKLHIDGGASALIANLDADVSIAKSISFRSDNSARINLEVSGTESGSNAGANFYLRTYSDAGALLATPLTITRSTSAITLTGALSGTSATFNTNSTSNAGFFQINDSTTTLGNSFATVQRNANDGNGRFSLSRWQVQNTSGLEQSAFIGAQAVTGASNYSPNLILGVSNGASSYTTYLTIASTGAATFSSTSGIGLTIQADWNRSATNDSQLYIKGSTNGNKQLRIGYDTTGNIGYLQALTSGTSVDNITINPSGGNIGIGTSDIVLTNLSGALTIRKSYSGDTPNGATTQDYYLNQSALFLFGRNSGLTIVSNNNEEGEILFANNSSRRYATIATGAGSSSTGGDMYFKVGSNVERMRITTNGYLKVSNNGTYYSVGGSYHEVLQSQSSNSCFRIFATSTAYDDAVLQTNCYRTNNSAYSMASLYSNNFADIEFNLRGDGQAYADGSWNGGGADYAEYFEWFDGNPSNEDRRGYSVSLVGNKIKIAEKGETIIGVISGNPSVVGDSAWNIWTEKYLRDDFGTYVRDENGDRILNSNYNPDIEYIPREQRPEWGIVGLMGKLCIRKGQEVMPSWVKMKDVSDSVEQWLIK